MKPVTAVSITVLSIVVGLGAMYLKRTVPQAVPPAASQAPRADAAKGPPAPRSESGLAPAVALKKDLDDLVAVHRKLIVLYSGSEALAPIARDAAGEAGQRLFHGSLDSVQALEEKLAAAVKSGEYATLEAVLGYVESEPSWFDADRLAFKDVLVELQDVLRSAQTLTAMKLHKRVSDDLDSLAEVEKLYEKELAQIFGRLDARGIELKRERWDDYVAAIGKLYTRERIVKEAGVVVASPEASQTTDEVQPSGAGADAAGATRGVSKANGKNGAKGAAKDDEFFTSTLPAKSLVLTFDDGPHPKYTQEIAAILKQYDVPGVFFQVGKNLGKMDPSGKPLPGPNAKIDSQLMAAGHAVGNHSFTHAQLNREHDDALRQEIEGTDRMLKEVSEKRSALFRYPYGARSEEGKAILSRLGLRSVLWNVDSLDWADPVPTSIADRVLREVAREKKGIVLFHDIHGRTVQALPKIIARLQSDGYRFARWTGSEFALPKDAATGAPQAAPPRSESASNWAFVIGIDQYRKWPRLQYAANDAGAVAGMVTERFGFAADHVIVLKDEAATRSNILSTFGTRLSAGKLGPDDQVFVFFAGHGATAKLSSGRTLGYIVPVDADPAQTATDAIPMTEIQNVAEGLSARHVLFVMDACYSGLGLVRGGADKFARDNARRVGRQMLTAGGADQTVADGGPGGHSVFTWTLLQALEGKADLNGDGTITATEIAAYVAPAVSSISSQTPAFGSLPGSEGGEFVFDTPRQKEYLTETTAQLPADAIALNRKLDEAHQGAGDKAGAVIVRNLDGEAREIAPPKALPASDRQRAEAANNKGLQLYQSKQYAQAESAFREALALAPDYAMAANNLGFVFYRQGRNAEAVEWFEKTLKIDPSRAVAYLNLADALAALHESAKAKSAYSTYVELAPNGPSVERAKREIAR